MPSLLFFGSGDESDAVNENGVLFRGAWAEFRSDGLDAHPNLAVWPLPLLVKLRVEIRLHSPAARNVHISFGGLCRSHFVPVVFPVLLKLLYVEGALELGVERVIDADGEGKVIVALRGVVESGLDDKSVVRLCVLCEL